MKKIAWCTPFSAASAISEFSHTLIESHNSDRALSQHSKIDVAINDNGRRYRSTSKCLGIRDILKSSDAINLFEEHYDHVFYNLGNNKENHQEIFELSQAVPGIAILHDYVYQHYLAGRIFSDCKAPNVYAYLMGRHYGKAGLASVYASQIMRVRESRIGLWDTDLTSNFPLIEAVVGNRMHKGVVVHSEMGRRAVAQAYDGPILQLRLPGDYVESPPPELCARWREKTATTDRVTIGVIGHIQRGKQIHRLIEAIFAAPHIADLIHSVIIAGKPSDTEYVEHLRRLLAGNPLGSLIRLELNVSHERLQEIKHASDFFVNMRYPNTEGGSGSLIEQMACNKPVIVLNSGIFAEVSSGVIKINELEDCSALQQAVYELASSPKMRIDLGNAAREYALSYLSKDYIKDIIGFSESIKSRPKHIHQFNVHDILLYDEQTRDPEPVFSWPADAFAVYARILFQHHFETELIDYLVQQSTCDPIGAYKQYSFARTLLSFFERAAKGEELKHWLFPTELSLNDCYVLACLKETHYHSLTLIFADFLRPQFTRWTQVVRRFSTTTISERFALQMSIWDAVENDSFGGEAENFHGIAKKTVPGKFSSVVRLVSTLEDNDFNRLLLGGWRQFFDSNQYQRSYLDLSEKMKADHETLVRHYEMHGLQEGRVAKIASGRLIKASEFDHSVEPLAEQYAVVQSDRASS